MLQLLTRGLHQKCEHAVAPEFFVGGECVFRFGRIDIEQTVDRIRDLRDADDRAGGCYGAERRQDPLAPRPCKRRIPQKDGGKQQHCQKQIDDQRHRDFDIRKAGQVFDARCKREVGQLEVVAVCAVFEQLHHADDHVGAALYPCGQPDAVRQHQQRDVDQIGDQKIKQQNTPAFRAELEKCGRIHILIQLGKADDQQRE